MGAKRKSVVKDEPMDTSVSAGQGSGRSDELIMEEEHVLNTYDSPTDLVGTCTEPFDTDRYCEKIKIEFVNESKDCYDLEFDLIGVEAPMANALRRVLIAEVPTMAIEKIYLYQNTSIIQDEVLCHRLGLLPLKVDPRVFDWPTEKIVGINENTDCDEEPTPDPTRHLVFEVNVACTKNRNAPKSATRPEALYINSSVYSKSFKWIPCGEQEEQFSDDPPRMVHDDILVAKMRSNQEIEARLHCVKGVGRDHAKFSPVATASYRLLPIIRLKEDITGEAAHRLQECFSKGVISITEKNGVETAVVKDARKDTCSRNVLRHEDLAKKVEMARKKQHYIFSVESTGALHSKDLVYEACMVMASKAATLRALIEDALEL